MFNQSIKFIVLIMAIGFSSCTITKRYHSFGYKIESRFPVKSSHRVTQQSVVQRKAPSTIREGAVFGKKSELSVSRSILVNDAMVQCVLPQTIIENQGVKVDHFNNFRNVEISNPISKIKIYNSLDETKVKIEKKVKSDRRGYTGIKGFLFIVAGVIVFFLGAEAWSYVLMLLGLILVAVGLLVILIGILRKL